MIMMQQRAEAIIAAHYGLDLPALSRALATTTSTNLRALVWDGKYWPKDAPRGLELSDLCNLRNAITAQVEAVDVAMEGG